MSLFTSLAAFAFRPLINSGAEVLGMAVGEKACDQIAAFLQNRFVDSGRRVTDSLSRAHDNAWRALEVALAGETLWRKLDRVDDKMFRQQVRLFLDGAKNNLPVPAAEFRASCLRELQAARKVGLLRAELDPAGMAKQVAFLARYNDPLKQLQAEWKLLDQMAHALRQSQYPYLAQLLEMRPAQHGPHLLLLAVRFYFRREIENDPALFQGLVYEQMDRLEQTLQSGLASLSMAITQQGLQLTQMLESLQEVVLDIHQELIRQGDKHRDIYEAVISLHDKLDMHHREVRPQDSMSLHDEQEKQLVKQLVSKYRSLPDGERKKLPALLNGIGKLEMAVGDFQNAVTDFANVIPSVADKEAQAEVYFNTYQALLEQRRFSEALASLNSALGCAPQRFAPFPVAEYEPEKILGAGGFGVAFLCKHRLSKTRVVIKSLLTTDLDRDVTTIFSEAMALEQVNHPAIIRLRHCGFTDPERKTRPYLVMDYFDGLTLQDYIKNKGRVSLQELFALVRPLAQALRAAHKKGILHRDVKPANVLVRRGSGGWQVKLIDFGLAMRSKSLQQSLSTARLEQTQIGHSVVGTLDYAAPEQLGKVPVEVGSYSDVFGFAKTCCFALSL